MRIESVRSLVAAFHPFMQVEVKQVRDRNLDIRSVDTTFWILYFGKFPSSTFAQ